MSKRYYCDYCDKSFVDDLDARRKHIQGTFHTRQKHFHYRQFRDLNTLYNEESAKNECRRFMQTGQCQFGNHCNFTHYSKAQLNEIKWQVEEQQRNKKVINLSTVESWLEKRNNLLQSGKIPFTPPIYPLYSSDLPASLRPINFFDAVNIELNDWG